MGLAAGAGFAQDPFQMGADGVEGDEEGGGGLFHREPGGQEEAEFGFALGEVEDLLEELVPGEGAAVGVQQLDGAGEDRWPGAAGWPFSSSSGPSFCPTTRRARWFEASHSH